MISFFYSVYGIYRLMINLLGDYFRLMRGVWTLSKLHKPVVSVFGGTRLSQDHPFTQNAHKLSNMLLTHQISVITGGGAGIMQAMNCGAMNEDPKVRGKSVGITVENLSQERQVGCLDALITTRYFFTRKWLLTRYSDAFVVFPGGFGTLDELFETLTLMQTGHLERVPVVLINTVYWKPLLEWVELAQKEGLLLSIDASLLFVTDDLTEAFNHLHKHTEC